MLLCVIMSIPCNYVNWSKQNKLNTQGLGERVENKVCVLNSEDQLTGVMQYSIFFLKLLNDS